MSSKINSRAQKAKWCPSSAESSKQSTNCIIEKAEDNAIFFVLSVVKVAPQARPKTTWYVWICFGRLDHRWNRWEYAWNDALTLKRASRSHAKTGYCRGFLGRK